VRPVNSSDAAIRDRLPANPKAQARAHTSRTTVTVNGGVADLWEIPKSDAERKAIRVGVAEGKEDIRRRH